MQHLEDHVASEEHTDHIPRQDAVPLKGPVLGALVKKVVLRQSGTANASVRVIIDFVL